MRAIRPNPVRFLTFEDVERGISEVAEITKREKVQAVLIGGAALHLYGSDRLTVDVDFIADRQPDGLPVIKTLSFGGVVSRSPSGVPVDIIVPLEGGPDETAWRQNVFAEALTYSRRIKGVPLPVASLEYLVVLKMSAGRAKDEADLDFILGGNLCDLPKARKLVIRLLGGYAAGDFDDYVRTAKWHRTKER